MNREKLTNYLVKVNKIITFITAILSFIAVGLYGITAMLLFEGFEAYALLGIMLVAIFTAVNAYTK